MADVITYLTWGITLTFGMVMIMLLIFVIVLFFLDSPWAQKIYMMFSREPLAQVRIIDHENNTHVTLVKHSPLDGHMWEGPVYWGTKAGELLLMPGGVVHPGCFSAYVFGWEFTDVNLQMEHALMWSPCATMADWADRSLKDKMQLREQLMLPHTMVM